MLRWAAVLGLLSLSYSACWELTVVHTNDMHAWLGEGAVYGGVCQPHSRCYGGFPRVKYFADWARKAYNNVIFLNAGDHYQGTNYYTMFKWEIILPFVNEMGFDVMSLGNHEFDDSLEGVEPFLKAVKAPWVCANLRARNESSFRDIVVERSHIINVEDKKIAVIGYLTPDTKYLGSMGNLTLVDEIDSLREEVKEVKKRGADIVIALGHSGWDKDIEIASSVEGLDLVVGGHSHTFHYTGPPPDKEVPITTYPKIVMQKSGKIVPMVQAYAFTKYVGVLNMVFDHRNMLMKATGNPVLMDQSIPQDKKLLKMLQPWNEKLNKKLNQKIGEITKTLNSSFCRLEECNTGDLITDAIVNYQRETYSREGGKGWTDTPIAILNSGTIRASISKDFDAGAVTLGTLLNVLPYDDKVVIVETNGTVFKQVLEHSVSEFHPNGTIESGQFLQFSGAQVVYNVSRSVGDRVVSVKVRCGLCDKTKYEPLTPDMNLQYLATGFLTSGGDGFTMLQNTTKQVIGSKSLFNIVKDYITKNSPINIEKDGRLKVIK